MTIKNIIFDVGNVIVRWSPPHIVATTFPDHPPHQQDLLVEALFKTDTWIQLNLGKISEKEAKAIYLATIDTLTPDRVDLLFDTIKFSLELIPGTLDIIQALHKNGYFLYSLTDNVKEIMHYLQERYDFWKYFKHVTVSAYIGMIKPNQDIFDYTLQKNQLLAHETLFIDDHLPNITTAKSIGLHTILFTDAPSCLQALQVLGVQAT